ncbi:MAG: M20/M25/M40 family metallo-hydrolase [Gemmatimonadota bacterium]|nr:M20/M25/M40 family metallo-hydrolase [Gemmatimonadota bacterium]
MKSMLRRRPFTPVRWSLRAAIGCATLVATDPAPLWAQTPTLPSDDSRVRTALQVLRDDNAWTMDQQVSLCEIPAPPFGEARRAAEYRRRLTALGLRNVRIDAEGNAIGERPGTGAGPTVVIAGHLDTVFPETTDVRTRRVGGRIYGPGIGDDCRGLAVVLAVARALQRAGVRTSGTVIFVGNVGEEGPGNLRGVRFLYDKELKGRIDYFISVDGTGLGMTSRAVGSNRYRVTYKGPGGHSYGDFGMPSPIHALGRAISRIADLQVPSTPKTTFNVGIVRGGTSVNSIAFEASMDVDMRSESAQSLADVDVKVRRMLAEALGEENARAQDPKARLSLVIDTIGVRPAGTQPDTSAIVRAAQAAAGALGFTVRPGASSTDANVPIGRGLPGIAIDGGGRGEGAHSLDEWYEDGPQGWLGPQWAALIVLTLAGVR